MDDVPIPQIEEWTPVPGFEGYYEVSTFGRIRSLDRAVTIKTKHGTYRRFKRGIVLTPARMRSGYLYVDLRSPDAAQRRTLHSLVAEAFLGPRPVGCEVCHEDGTRAHNALSNLRYDTRQGNAGDMIDHGRSQQGARHHGAKLTEAAVVEIRHRRRCGEHPSDIAALFGTTRENINMITSNRSWRHVPDDRLFSPADCR